MLDSLIIVDTLLPGDALIELLHGERFSAPGARHVGGYLWRKLGGEVGGLVAC
jgi:hypothetical protein